MLILVLLRVLTREYRFVKIISLYTFRTLCFPETYCDGQIVDEEGVHKKNLHRSLVVVACLWASLGFLVTVNVAVDGVHRFYGPTGYCKPRPIAERSDFERAQGAGFAPTILSNVRLPTLFSCG